MSKTVDKERTTYISREAVDDVLCDLSERTQTYPFMAIAVAMAIDKIDSIPNADVAPVIQGHWIINSDGYYPQCSNCMREPESGKMTKFCPNCGVKMDEVVE